MRVYIAVLFFCLALLFEEMSYIISLGLRNYRFLYNIYPM